MVSQNLIFLLKILLTSLTSKRLGKVFVYYLVYLNIHYIIPKKLLHKLPFLQKRPSRFFTMGVTIFIYYVLYNAVVENTVEFKLSKISRGLLDQIVKEAVKKQKIENILPLNEPFDIMFHFRLSDIILQCSFALFAFHSFCMIRKHKPVTLYDHYKKAIKKFLDKDIDQLSEQEWEKATNMVESYILKNVYPYTYKLRLKSKYLLSFKCDKCNLPITYAEHSKVSEQCYHDYNHYCPWVGKEIYLNNFANFYFFAVTLAFCSSYTLYKSFCIFQFLFITIQRISPVPLGFMYKFTVLLFSLNNSIEIYIDLFLLSILVLPSCLAQMIGQLLNLFKVQSMSDREQLRYAAIDCAKNKFRILNINNISEMDIENNEKVLIDSYIVVENKNRQQPNEPIIYKDNQNVKRQSLSAKESVKVIKKIAHQYSFLRLLEHINYFRFV